MITRELLIQMFPKAAKTLLDLDQIVAALNTVFTDSVVGLSSVVRQASFLAQLAHESASFTAIVENLNYSSDGLLKTFHKYFPTKELADQYARKPVEIASRVYANRLGNGNEASNEGFRYRGRGFLQITGKDNYTTASLDLKIDFVSRPELVATPKYAVETALWFWRKHNLNSYADKEDIRGMTKVINGGYNGLEERVTNYETAKRILSTKG